MAQNPKDDHVSIDDELLLATTDSPITPKSETIAVTIDTSQYRSNSAQLRRRKTNDTKILSEEEFISQFHQKAPVNPGEETKRVLRVTKSGYEDCSIQKILEYDINELEPLSQVEDKSMKIKPTVWFDIDSISKQDMQDIEDKFDLHPLTIEDILTPDSREKVDNYDHYVFVVAKEMHYSYQSNRLVSSNVNVVIFPNLVLTFHSHDVESIPKVFYMVEKSLNKGNFLESSAWALYAILDGISKQLRIFVNNIVMEGEALDELVLIFNAGEQSDLLRRVGLARRTMTTLRGQVWSKKELLSIFINRNHVFINNETKFYLRDVLDHLLSMEQRLDAAKEMLNNLHSTYLARVSVEMAEASGQVNTVMKRFSAVATIFIPFTLIAGLWGMNVKVPGREDDNYDWFIGICLLSLLTGITVMYIFKKRGCF